MADIPEMSGRPLPPEIARHVDRNTLSRARRRALDELGCTCTDLEIVEHGPAIYGTVNRVTVRHDAGCPAIGITTAHRIHRPDPNQN